MSTDTQEAYQEGFKDGFKDARASNVWILKQAHDALLAFGRACNGTDATIIALRQRIEESQKDFEND